jgi:predicted dehydrogenase
VLARSYGIEPRLTARLEDVHGYVDGAIIATPNATHKMLAGDAQR